MHESWERQSVYKHWFDELIIKKEFFLWLTSTPVFLDACQKASMGETQRIRLQKDAFSN